MKEITGNIVDIENRRIYPSRISIFENRIVAIEEIDDKDVSTYILPGFIDAHVHIESSMLTPHNFSNAVIRRGCVAIVNDPHEIANVLGKEGIKYMLEDARTSSIKMFFTLPSCVPATPFDISGAILSASDMDVLLEEYDFVGISEMMNVEGVLNSDSEVMAKLSLSHKYEIPVDGHAPGLRGDKLAAYIGAGISTDHESFETEEALEKISGGMKILIREGSAAKNYEALKSLISHYSDSLMFCTDDSHPEDILEEGHIDKIVKKAIRDGFDLFDVLKIACCNPVKHYKLDVGLLKIGDKADFIEVNDLKNFGVERVFIDGEIRYDKKMSLPNIEVSNIPNKFNRDFLKSSDIAVKTSGRTLVINVKNGSLITDKSFYDLGYSENFESDISKDVLKIVYMNRYTNAKPRIAFIHGFGLKKGAIASSVGHDSHNILAVGCKDADICNAVNLLIQHRGGLVFASEDFGKILPLPVGGIMCDKNAEDVAGNYTELNRILKSCGCILDSPFMTLAFMSLIVIPYVKIGEGGIFDYQKFRFISE